MSTEKLQETAKFIRYQYTQDGVQYGIWLCPYCKRESDHNLTKPLGSRYCHNYDAFQKSPCYAHFKLGGNSRY